MKTSTLLFIITIILLGGIGGYLLLQNSTITGPATVPTASDFGEKIVYEQSPDFSKDQYIAHCEAQGGQFNECGSECEPGAQICTTVCALTCENIGEDDNDTQSEDSYRNEAFGISLKVPNDSWTVELFEDVPLSPKINVYRQADITDDSVLPFDHFANETHVSMYPEGIPTEGLFGETVPFNEEGVSLSFDINDEDSKLYVLEDGTPFAAMIVPQDRPRSWTSSGFMWARVEIENYSSTCLRDGEVVDEETCDPLMEGDTIVRNGVINQDTWDQEMRILKSIQLTDQGQSNNNTDVGRDTTQTVFIDTPEEGSVITSPLVVTGDARGTWFFEATAPIVLTDWDGKIIAESYIEAKEDWMTESYVPFEGVLEFETPYQSGDPEFMKSGILILQKSNPSGLPENDDAVEISVEFEAQ